MQPLRFVSLALALALGTSCSSDSGSGASGTGGSSGAVGAGGSAPSSAGGGTNPNAGGAGGSSSGGGGTANGGVAGSSLGGTSGSGAGGAGGAGGNTSALPDGGVAGSGTAGAAGAGSDSGLPPVAGPCCEATGAQGCTDKTVQDCVCAQDPLCCKAPGSVANAGWGAACVALIGSLACGTACPTNDCCTASTEPGCTDTAIKTCVCAKDDSCCATAWNLLCVSEVSLNFFGGTCGTCP